VLYNTVQYTCTASSQGRRGRLLLATSRVRPLWRPRCAPSPVVSFARGSDIKEYVQNNGGA
jgi:hypothetical protein